MNASHVLDRTPGSPGYRTSDLHALPVDGPRYELIEGSLVVSPPPTGAETALSQCLANTLEVANRGSPLVVDRGQPVRIGEHDEVRPDIVVAHVSMAETTPIPADALMLVVEVVSQSSVLRDTATKRALYGVAGVPAYWIVLPQRSPVGVAVTELRLNEATGQYIVRTPPTSARFGTDHPWPVTVDVPALAEQWSALVLDAGRRGEEA
ncbi:Uma2 family endonuclease [Jiangella ureilytica]|uniref:Uma2 family endonuclease n=1 Tax=Jiangella ureilytica TaxID=2530374 RepID=UPI0013A5CED1|nr:Uma2 family endonuclease [Jiangella ureilytica]